MTMTSASMLLVLLAAASVGKAEPLVAMEAGATQLPPGWSAGRQTPREERIELTFAVKQRGLEQLHDTLMRVSRPSSPDYGMHLFNEEVQALTAPHPAHIHAVFAFLTAHGAVPRAATPNSDFVVADVPVPVAEAMLSTQYVQLHHAATGVQVARAPGGYSLPASVAAAVDFVAPTVHVPGVRRPTVSKETANNASLSEEALGLGFNTPKNLRKLYSVSAEGKAPRNKQAVTAFLEEGYSKFSLKAFWWLFCHGITCGKGNPALVGDATGGRPGVEAMLDIETITGVAGNVESEFWGFSGRSPDNPENEPFMKWLTKVSSTSDADVPEVFSTSYGEDESSWSLPAARRLNVEFQKAGVRGISLLYASGDEGANCKEGHFVPEGPGSSPYVTAVGGTGPTAAWPQPGGEAAIGLSSGGFSSYWPMPDYQKTAVAGYLSQKGLPDPSVGYNTSGRAYPDISAQATKYFVIAGLPQPGVAGTSCATPAAAGVFALLNDVRLQAGKSTLGFLNPFIYEHAAAFNDITTGSGGGGCSFGGGWPAKAGWDAVTGVGTPNFEKLAKVVEALPAGRATLPSDTAIVV